jgi:hypothetical protein
MKVNRQRISEEYNTTVDWVNDFANNLEKNADYLSNLRSIMKKRNDFSTIDEKMADLKARAGFDLIKNIDNDGENKKSASCCEGCSKGTGGCSSCSCGKSKCSTCNKDTHNTLRNILNYIKEFSSDRPEAGYGTIISHCREHPKLGFDRVESKIDHNKFKSLIEKILGGRENNPDEVKYMPEAEMSFEENEDIADYMAHASPG